MPVTVAGGIWLMIVKLAWKPVTGPVPRESKVKSVCGPMVTVPVSVKVPK